MDLARAFAGIATMASAAFGGLYFAARLIRYTDPILDDGGSIIVPSEPVSRDCLAQVDVMTEGMRAQQGFAERDVRILILQASLTALPEVPFDDASEFDDGAEFVEVADAPPITTDETLQILAGLNAGSYSIQSVGADPVAIGWEVRGRPV